MSSTVVPDPGPIRTNLSPSDILHEVHKVLVVAQGDLDKCGDVEGGDYYQGMVDALKAIEEYLTS